jgi:hypothetical protein
MPLIRRPRCRALAETGSGITFLRRFTKTLRFNIKNIPKSNVGVGMLKDMVKEINRGMKWLRNRCFRIMYMK